jgi:hypothetical protein
MENKFRYILSPENIYKVMFQDDEGNTVHIEVSGEQIVAQIKDKYLAESDWAKPISIVKEKDL